MIKVFEKLPYKRYVRKSPKHKPTDSYFYIAIKLAKCMMRADAFIWNVDPVRMEITGTQHIPILDVSDLDESKTKLILSDEKLSQLYYMDKGE